MSVNPEHVVLVTGGAGGIGLEIVRHLIVDHGAGVVATDLVEGELGSLKQQYPANLRVVLGNIVDPKTSELCVETAVKDFGKLTAVCLNAGLFGPCYPIANSTVEKWAKAFEVNVLSHLHTLKYAIPELRKTSGRVTATTSGAGQNPLFSGWGLYGMSKASVAFLIKQLALEEPNITALGLSPGLCDTKMISGLLSGAHEGWTLEDARKYKDFTSQIDLISPDQIGYTFAATVTSVDHSLSGQIVDYDDPRLPIKKSYMRKSEKEIDYTAFVKGGKTVDNPSS